MLVRRSDPPRENIHRFVSGFRFRRISRSGKWFCCGILIALRILGFPQIPHHFLLGARQSRRAIARYLSWRVRDTVPTSASEPRQERIHCAYPSRSSLASAVHPCAASTRPRRAAASPAITTAQLWSSARAPEIPLRSQIAIHEVQII